MKPTFSIGATVYQRVNPDNVGMVTAHVTRERGALTYLVMWSNLEEGEHMEAELTTEREYGVSANGGLES